MTTRAIALSEVLEESDERLGSRPEPEVLTLTEKNGFLSQRERFNKRLAVDDTSDYKVVRRFDVAFNPYLLWAGAVAQNVAWDEGIISPLYPTFRIRTGYEPRYIDRLLRSPGMVARYDSIAFGSVPRKRRTTVADFLSLKISEPPPFPEQRRIAGMLDKADALRAKRRAALVQLDMLTQSLFRNSFGNIGEGNGRWPSVPLERIVRDTKLGLVRGSTEVGPDLAVPYVRMNAITRTGELDLSHVQGTRATDDEIEAYRLMPGDFLFNTRNSKELVGKTALYRANGLHLFNNNIMRIRFTSNAEPSFMAAVFRTPFVQQELDLRKSGTTNVFAIYYKDLRTLAVPLPPIDLQRKFSREVAAIEMNKAAQRKHLGGLNALFASLQSRCFERELSR